MMGKRTYNLNVVELIKQLRSDKKKIMIYCVVGGIIGIIVAFSIPRIYKSQVELAPEETSNSFSGSISSLASMVGMNMNFGSNGDAIYPEIYPDMIGSTRFMASLFNVKVTSKDGKIKDMPYAEYLRTKQKAAWWTYPSNWVKNIIKKLKSSDGGRPKGSATDPFWLTMDEYLVTKAMGGRIKCGVDKKTSVITLTITDQDPLIAATMADSVTAKLQEFITEYRTNKARRDLEYMNRLFDEAKSQYTEARQKYARFSEANNNVVLPSIESKLDELENEMQLKYNIYTQVVEQQQMAQAKLRESTPAFTTLQNATVPIKHSNKPKILILAVFVILAFLLRLIILSWHHKKELFVSNG